ncbi:MAG: TlpA family protein disulfide reductase [Deltaproteobacteria bacterium]|jgi:thiol-disulfide isomerase/thioredoxin|nr:TlpA family protein disulfide reductase [Deltaproteobacteria bacterium]
MARSLLCSALFLGCVACASGSSPGPVTRAAASTPLEFSLPDSHGDTVDLKSYRGRPVILDFWASWCEPCKTAMPFFDELQAKYGDQLVVIGVSVDEHQEAMKAALAQRPVRFLIVHDQKGSLAQQLEVTTMPSTYLVGRDGVVRKVHRGFVPSDQEGLEAEVQALLAQSGAP